jgi:hypothetical protein
MFGIGAVMMFGTVDAEYGVIVDTVRLDNRSDCLGFAASLWIFVAGNGVIAGAITSTEETLIDFLFIGVVVVR